MNKSEIRAIIKLHIETTIKEELGKSLKEYVEDIINSTVKEKVKEMITEQQIRNRVSEAVNREIEHNKNMILDASWIDDRVTSILSKEFDKSLTSLMGKYEKEIITEVRIALDNQIKQQLSKELRESV